jgi:hypothetical protein
MQLYFNLQFVELQFIACSTEGGRTLLRSVIVFLLCCAFASAQEMTPAKSLPTIPPPIRVSDITMTPDPDIEISVADSLPVLTAQCDDKGDPFVKTIGANGFEILGLMPSGIVVFATNQMNDIPEPSTKNVFVGSSSLYLLVSGMENAHKDDVVYKDESGQEKKMTETKGDIRYYIARFDLDGSYRGALKLDSGFQPMQLAAFDSGTFVVAGLDENKTPRVALFNSSAQMVQYLQLPGDITDKPQSVEKSFAGAAGGISASAEVLGMFAQLISQSGKVLLVRAGTGTPIYEIRDTGEVEEIQPKIPHAQGIDRIIPSDHNLFLEVRANILEKSVATIYEINPEDGTPIQGFRFKSDDQFRDTVSCAIQKTFTGIRHQQGKLTLLRGAVQ